MKKKDDFLKQIMEKKLIFTKHAEIRMEQRKITREEIIDALKDVKNIEIIEKERENSNTKIKLMYQLSKRKGLIIVMAINNNIRIITVYRTSKISKLLKKVNVWKRR